eukprot:354542-Chlamydomonas_euryale.AAC.10
MRRSGRLSLLALALAAAAAAAALDGAPVPAAALSSAPQLSSLSLPGQLLRSGGARRLLGRPADAHFAGFESEWHPASARHKHSAGDTLDELEELLEDPQLVQGFKWVCSCATCMCKVTRERERDVRRMQRDSLHACCT